VERNWRQRSLSAQDHWTCLSDFSAVSARRLRPSIGIVNADGPEGVNRHVFNVNLVNCFAIVFRRRNIEIDCVLLGNPAPRAAVPIRCLTGSTCSLVPNAFLKSGIVEPSTSNASCTFFRPSGVPVWEFKLTRIALADIVASCMPGLARCPSGPKDRSMCEHPGPCSACRHSSR
jgi:hypothetical protein